MTKDRLNEIQREIEDALVDKPSSHKQGDKFNKLIQVTQEIVIQLEELNDILRARLGL